MSEKLYKCECCDREFDEEEYQLTNEKVKCILHCGKENWENEINFNIRDSEYSNNRIIIFWQKIRELIEKQLDEVDSYNTVTFERIIFPLSEGIQYYDIEYDEDGEKPRQWSYDFYEGFSEYQNRDKTFIFNFSACVFMEDLDLSGIKIESLTFNNKTVFEKGIKFNNSNIESFTVNDCIFKNNLEIENCILVFGQKPYNYAFQNCIFEDELYFKNVTFGNPGSNITFNKIEFQKDVIFNACKNLNELLITNLNNDNCKKISLFQMNVNRVITEDPFLQIKFEDIDINEFSMEKESIISLFMYDSTINKKLELNNKVFKGLRLIKSTFKEKVEIKESNIEFAFSFKDSKFYKTVDLYKTKFITEINKLRENDSYYKFEDINNKAFYKTDFKEISVFTESEFFIDIHFKYTTFEKFAIFRDGIFHQKINLRDSIFKDNSNFLDIKINELSRETARIIKNSFEQQNNIIEANKFYALEMKEREKELEKDLKNGKNILNWLIFKIHGITSNHSQNWEYSLFWIIIISLFYSYGFDFLSKKDEYINILHMNYQESFLYCIQTNKELYNFFKLTMWMMSPFIIVSFISNYSYKLLYFFLCIFLIVLYIYLTNDFTLSIVANNINPFSIITEKGNLGLAELLYRVSIAFLIYQLIVSIRQNTRRK